jgi:PAS domain S-box-containing protein
MSGEACRYEDGNRLGREAALEAEIVRLRAALARAGLDTGRAQAETVAALQEISQARNIAADAAANFAREMEAGQFSLAEAASLNRELRQANAALETSRAALAGSEEQFRLIVENARDYAIFTSDPDGRITGWFSGAAAIFGWTAEEAVGRPGAMLYTPEDREQGVPEKEIETARALGAAANVRWHMRQDGSRVFIEGTRTALRNPDGELRGFLKIGQNMTERRRSEEALRESEERLRSAVKVGRLALWDWNIETDTTAWSDEHFRLEGYEVGEVRPSYETWAARLHPDDRAATEAALRHAKDNRQEYAHEFRTLHPDGSIHWCSARGQFFYDDAGKPLRMVGAMVETTERREWEERQNILMAELQHRTRNLLAVVQSISTRTLASCHSLDEFRDRFGPRLEALSRVNGLLSRLEEGDRITFDELIQAELSAHGGLDDHGRGSQIMLRGPDGVRLRSATVQTLALALHELATNAVKYGALSSPAGRLSVRWHIVPAEGGTARLCVEWEERNVVVAVAEDGTPPRRGYGRELIEWALPYQLKAKTLYHFTPDGVRCIVDLPIPPSTGDAHA